MDIEVFNYENRQFVITDAKNIKWSSHYGEDGSGFGYLKFNLEREVGTRYNDVGFGYRVKVRKGLVVVHDGTIREIAESTKNGVGTISVSAVGHVIMAEDTPEILRNFCNTDLSKWVVPSQVPGNLYRPDLFATSSSEGGLILNATTQPVAANSYTELKFEFYENEIAERIKFDILLNLGRGVTFDADVDSIDEPNKYIFYKNHSDETVIAIGMTLVNITQNLTATVDAINTGLNRITIPSSPGSWALDDEIYIQGPLFIASVVSVAATVITYTSEIGEGNISTAYQLVNLAKKFAVGIVSNDTGANTITADVDVSTWTQNDTIIIAAPLFSANISGVSGTQITYSSEVGERVVTSDAGWVLHNVAKDEVATVASWTAPNKLDVTVAGEISTWSGNNIAIYTPYRAEVRDSNNAILWPSDWRSGAIAGSTTGINVLTTGSPTSFRVLFKAYIAGAGDETSFARLSGVKAYSTEDDVTMETISKAMLTDMVTLGADSSEIDIASITKIIEPSVFEFKDIKEVLSESAKFGSQNGNQVSWGIRLNDLKRFFIEEFPTEVKYIVAKSLGNSDVEVSADMSESVQRIRGVYTDKLGNRVIMDWVEETDQYYGSYYISRTETLQNVDNEVDALAYIQLLFDKQKAPPLSSSYVTKGDVIRDIYGNTVPFDEVRADGSYIEVEDFRASITETRVSDLSANWVRDRLVAAEIDVNAKSVKLIPGKALKTFEIYMAELSRIAKL